MKNLRYLASVGVVGLVGGLLAAPAYAADEDSDAPVTLSARGTFQGFTIEARDMSIAPGDLTLADFRASRTIEGTPVLPDPELIVRDDVGINFGDPDNLVPSAVHLFRQDNTTGGVFFNCTGTLINPRTVLSAAHCFNSLSSEAYGLPGAAPNAILVATGQSSANRVFDYLDFGLRYSEGGVATSTDVIIHPSANLDNGALPFPWADVAFVALDEPILDTPTLPLLLSPLTELTHVLQVGYGTNGTGLTGATNAGNRFLRRVGENMLGAIASSQDLIDTIFPGFAPSSQTLGFETQALYFVDFDNPNRVGPGEERCVFSGTGISCQDTQAVLDLDWFDGDALPGEVATAPGDSGSAIIVDQLYDFQVVAGVLSGGFDFFGVNNRYSDISFYNPLYPFFEFITENTPYKYVSAKAGDGAWSDPGHWTQDLDPGFFIDDGNGNLINGIPTGTEPGVFEAGPKLGLILGEDISGNDTTPAPILGDFDASLPESSALLGPGSTGFVPQNTDGTPGTAFANPAQYFEVHLNRAGRTTVDIDVEIDKLVVNSGAAELFVQGGRSFTAIQDIEQLGGLVEVDGTVNTPFYILAAGELAGDGGTINTNALFNVSGLMNAGGVGGIGSLMIDGDYVQSSGGALLSEFEIARRNTITADTYNVTGTAVLDGLLIVSSGPRRPRFGTEYVALSAGAIDGAFDEVALFTNSATLGAVARVEGNDVVVEIVARRLQDMLGPRSNLQSLGAALDEIRFSNFAQFTSLFDVVDGASMATLGATLSSLTPTNAFNQTLLANSFSHRFTGQIAQRTLSLRGGSQAAAGFSAAGGAVAGIAQTGAAEPGKLGFFSTVSGSFLVTPEQRSTGANALEEAAFTQAGELTLGADFRMSEDLTIGFAMTSLRNGMAMAGGQPRGDDTNFSGAVYAALQLGGGGFSDMYLGFSRQNFGLERAAQGDLSAINHNAVGLSEGRQTFGGMRLGYAFDILPGLEAGPVASVDYVRNDLGGYAEMGAGQFGLTVLDRSFTSVGGKAGLMASLDTNVGRRGKLSAFGSVAYARELADTQDVVTAAFAGSGTTFDIVNQLDTDWVAASAGADLALNSRFSIGVSGHSDLGRGVLTNNQARFNLNWKF